MIKAIIFDCYGVLVADGWQPFKAKYFSEDPERMQQATDLNKQADSGLISNDDFEKAIAQLADINPESARQQIQSNPPNQILFDYVKTLETNYKLGILSNASASWLNKLLTPEQLALFDSSVLSYETGFVKPQPEAYELVASQLGVLPSECVFIDDQERHCTGAKEVGMQAILYTDVAQTKADLNQILQAS